MVPAVPRIDTHVGSRNGRYVTRANQSALTFRSE